MYRFLAVYIALVAGAVLRADRFGNVVFEVPSGWQKIQRGDTVELTPIASTPANRATLSIFPGQPLRGDFRDQFASFVQSQMRSDEKVTTQNEITQQTSATGIPILSRIVGVQHRSGQNRITIYLGFQALDRLELMTLAMPNYEVYKQIQPMLKEFITHAQFANVGSANQNPVRAESAPAIAPGQVRQTEQSSGLQGWYVSTVTKQTFNAFTQMYDYNINRYYYYFEPDGRLCQGLPAKQSMDGFDYQVELRQAPGNCGTYSITAGTISLKYGDGKMFSHPFRPVAAGIQIAGNIYRRIRPAVNVRLQGTFGHSSYVAAAGVSGDRRITFTADGQFTMRGFVGLVATTRNGGATTSRQSGATGAYRISGYTMELDYSDGRRESVRFFRYPGEEDSTIVLNDVVYTQSN